MDRLLKAKEFISWIIAFVISLFTVGYNMATWQGKVIQEVANLKLQVDEVKEDNKQLKEENKKMRDYLDDKIEPMRKDITDIKIMLQNKQDRP